MGMPDFSLVINYLAGAMGDLMTPLASFKCDILDPQSTRDKRGHTQPGQAKAINPTPLPCEVADVTGAEIFVSGRRVVVAGTIITVPLLFRGFRVEIMPSHRVRVLATAQVPERVFEIEHVGDDDGVKIAIVVKRLRA